MNTTIYLGTFDSEAWWRSPNLTKLPSIKNDLSQSVTLGMDDLLFPLCKEQDILFTRQPMDDHFKSYLSLIGYNFKTVHTRNHLHRSNLELHVFDILLSDENYFKQQFPQEPLFSPYSVISDTTKVLSKFNSRNDLSDLEAVRKVNSKMYSHELRERIGVRQISFPVFHSSELFTFGLELLQTGQVLVKDSLGVSGNGNVLIPNEKLLKRITSYVSRQEAEGKETQFIIEPYLDKAQDFSCQLFITRDGKVEFISIQCMINQSFSYSGSYPAQAEFIEFLRKNNYFHVMEEACNVLYASGYYGDVCIDSMLLTNQEMIPIVEINARKSMGLINHHLNYFLGNYALNSYLTFLPLGYSAGLTMKRMLEGLRVHKLLFTPDNRQGIIPLSSNTIFASENIPLAAPESRLLRGKLYLAAPYTSDVKEAFSLIAKVKESLKSLAIKMY